MGIYDRLLAEREQAMTSGLQLCRYGGNTSTARQIQNMGRVAPVTVMQEPSMKPFSIKYFRTAGVPPT